MKRSQALIVVSILFLLVLTSNEPIIGEMEHTLPENQIPSNYRISNLVPHDPFNISSNADFVSQGWPGSGSYGEPFIIEGLSIVSLNRCIYISDTTAWFIIRNCSFVSPVYYSDFSLIEIDNSINGRIVNCTLFDSRSSIQLSMCKNFIISGSTFMNVSYGIRVEDECYSINIENNTFDLVRSTTITSYTSERIHVNGNTFSECRSMVYSVSVDYLEFIDNYQYSTIEASSYSGIYLSYCDNPEIRNNTIIGAIDGGIILRHCNESIVQENYIDIENYAFLISDGYDSDVGYNQFFSDFDSGAHISRENNLEFHHNNMDYLVVSGDTLDQWSIN
ncbi:MAG: right-handed parallel beta-helix repeat-containing protein, partial [Candidatus Thorarchaeota archaeon]